MIPQDVKMTKTHEWARVEENTGTVEVGITDYAVEQLGDIVYIELPSVGAAVKADTTFGVIESAKAAVELCSPVDGEVVEVNEQLTTNFDVLSEDPYGKAWMLKIKAEDLTQMDALMTATEYEAYRPQS